MLRRNRKIVIPRAAFPTIQTLVRPKTVGHGRFMARNHARVGADDVRESRCDNGTQMPKRPWRLIADIVRSYKARSRLHGVVAFTRGGRVYRGRLAVGCSVGGVPTTRISLCG